MLNTLFFFYELKKNNGRYHFTLTGILVSITAMKLVRSFLIQITQSWGKSLYDFFWPILCKSSCEDCQVCFLKIKRKIFVGFPCPTALTDEKGSK